MFYDLPIPKNIFNFIYSFIFFFSTFLTKYYFCYTMITPNSKKHIMMVQPSISDKNTMLSDSPTRAEYLKLNFYHEIKTYTTVKINSQSNRQIIYHTHK